ncbi:MAG: phage tail protein [Eubacterium sp.]
MELSVIKQACIGLDIFSAKNKLFSLYSELSEADIDITYQESDYQRFIVIDCELIDDKKIMLYATSKNAVRYLPSNFQENDFLNRFLMIFQHLQNDISIKIDNINELFRPMHCPFNFLQVLANWLGINVELLGTEKKRRLFLQYAIPLFRLRGTILGLKIYVYILTGIVPEIIEDYVPYSRLDIFDNTDIRSAIFDKDRNACVFTVLFPVEKDYFDDNLIKRLSLLLQQEKPVNTDCYICFKRTKEKTRKRTIIDNKSIIDKIMTF